MRSHSIQTCCAWLDTSCSEATQATGCAVGKAPRAHWKQCVTISKRNRVRNFSLIADARDRASEISFYLREKRTEGPGHPPVYIPESQDMVNQFSFWPRYDEFVELRPGARRPEGEVYTEENGINLFVGRDAIFVRNGEKQRVPHNIQAGFQSTELVGTIEVSRYGKPLRTWQVFLCRNYRTLPL